MQFKQARQAVAVRRAYVLQQLTIEYGGRLLVRRQPVFGESDVLYPDQLHGVAHRLVDQRLRLVGIELPSAHQGVIDVVNAHGAHIRPGDAAKGWSVPGGGRRVHVNKTFCCCANSLHQSGRGGLLLF